MTVEQEETMFGCRLGEFMDSVTDSLTFRFAEEDHGEKTAFARVAMSLLSDAQEEIVRGMHEDARQTINRAKFLLGQIEGQNETGKQICKQSEMAR